MNGVLLDTSFLITLTTPHRNRHEVAKRFYQEFIARGVPMHLSSIVVSEFEVRQRTTDLGLKNFLIVPFNYDHALIAAKFVNAALHQERGDGYSRIAIKDDVKLLAQCALQGITHFATDDRPCANSIDRLRKTHPAAALPFAILLEDGYEEIWFSPGHQGGLILD